MEHLECSDHHAGFSSCKVRQFPEQLNELKKVSSLVNRWEQRFDELSGSLPSPQIMKENFHQHAPRLACSLRCDFQDVIGSSGARICFWVFIAFARYRHECFLEKL
jgi:hypothetical protein